MSQVICRIVLLPLLVSVMLLSSLASAADLQRNGSFEANDNPARFGLLKITFWDESNILLVPASISVGVGNPNFPGVESLPWIDKDSLPDTWIYSVAQGVAPEGTVRVQFELTNVNFSGFEQPIWFDNIVMEKVTSSENLGGNGSFETGLDPWISVAGFSNTVEQPVFGAQEGDHAAKLTNLGGRGVAIILQSFAASPGDEFRVSGYMASETKGALGWIRTPWSNGSVQIGAPAVGPQEGVAAVELSPTVSVLYQDFPAKPGQEFHASGYMLAENQLADGEPPNGAFRSIKLSFFPSDLNGNPDTSAVLAPASVIKGQQGADPFPGIEGLPLLDSTSTLNEWQKTESQGVAPEGTEWVRMHLFNIDQTGAPQPVWFDNVVVALKAAPELGSNLSFESSTQLDGWRILAGSDNRVENVGSLARDGQNVAVLSGPEFSMVTQRFPASPGDEFYFSGHMLTETPLPVAVSENDVSFGLLKIVFWDEFGNDLPPASVSKGTLDAGQFPGVLAPALDSGGPVNEWFFSEAQGVAPAGTREVEFFMFNINFFDAPGEPVVPRPIWFDDMQIALLSPDMDGDGIANNVDTDPLDDTNEDFSDGTTSGSIASRGDQVLTVSDEPGSQDGVRIVADPTGGTGAARISVCGSAASILVRAGNELRVTCGSVILKVEAGDPVAMEITLGGEVATVTVPPDYQVTYAPELGDSLEVNATSPEPPVASVELSVGGTTVPLVTGQTLLNVEIDIKPGSDSNCMNINGHGVIPVAVLGSESFDVVDIDPSTLEFGGLGLRMKGNGMPSCGLEDVNIDGYDDLVCHFEDDPSSWSTGSDVATLAGALNDGTLVSGTDAVCIVP